MWTIAIFGGEEHLAVGDEGRAPDAGLGFVNPVDFSGFGIEAVEIAIVFGDEEQAVLDARRGN